MSIRKYLLFFLVVIISFQTIGQTRINVVTTAVPMLRISPDARSGAMGDLGIATTPDANASFWNAAKIPFSTTKSAAGITYTPWLRSLGLNDVYIITGAGYYKFAENQALFASLRYFNLGTIQFTDFSGNPLGTFRPYEFAIDAGYTRALSNKLGLGIAARYIYSNLANSSQNGTQYKPGTAVAADVSLYYNGLNDAGKGFTAGAVMSNLGNKINYTNTVDGDFIPANLGLGAMYHAVLDETSKISLGVDLNKLLVPTPPAGGTDLDLQKYRSQTVAGSWFSSFNDAPRGVEEELQEVQISAGVEYAYDNMFFVRAGYFYEDQLKGNRRFFTAGVGVVYNMITFNFSYLIPSGQGVNQNPLSNTTRFGVIFDLSGKKSE
jgi:hypothetical protein